MVLRVMASPSDDAQMWNLEEKLGRMKAKYEMLAKVISSGNKPQLQDMKELRKLAEKCCQRLKMAMADTPRGHDKRTRLVVHFAIATRVLVDVRAMCSREEDSGSEDVIRWELIGQARTLIEAEVAEIIKTSDCTPYSLGVELAWTLADYMLLRKDLLTATTGEVMEFMVVSEDGQLQPVRGTKEVIWDDGLDDLRRILSNQADSNKTSVSPLETVSDANWYLEFKQLPQDSPMTAIPEALTVQQLLLHLRVLKHVAPLGVCQEDVDVLQRLVLPQSLQRVQEKINQLLRDLGVQVRVNVGVENCLPSIVAAKRVEACPHSVVGAEFVKTCPPSIVGAKCVKTLFHGRRRAGRNWVAIAVDATGVLYAGVHGKIKCWRKGIELPNPGPYASTHSGVIYDLALAADGSLFFAGEDAKIVQWKDRTPVATLLGHAGAVRCLAFASDGKLVSGSADKTLRIWSEGMCVQVLAAHQDVVYGIAVGPQSPSIFSGSRDGTIKVWSENQVSESMKLSYAVWSVKISPSGDLFSGGDEGLISHWKGNRVHRDYVGHQDTVNDLVFADEGFLASASDDKTVKIWHDGDCVATLKGHTDYVVKLALGPDDTLYSSSLDGTIKMWRFDRAVE